MFKQGMFRLALVAAVIATNAQAFDFNGTTTASIPLTNQSHIQGNPATASAAAPINHFKKVTLMKANLSAKEKRAFTGFDPRLEKSAANTAGLPASVDLGMNNVPVLDQGAHGTCVTFATTAAMNAMIGKGDYISQLCSLELGSYLEERSDLPSGWDGSMGALVLDQITGYGFIPMSKQKEGVCAGVTAYPLNNELNTGKPMSLEDFHAAREKAEQFYWEPILTSMTRVLHGVDHGYKANAVLQAVKKALATPLAERQSRVTFGVLLPTSHCFIGACAKYHKNNDTWALTDDINYDILTPQLDGHEMVITGYDDHAVVTDNEGKTHQGIFTLRNSWGTDVGDDGNFYMTYDFFKKFVFEVQQIVMMEEGGLQQQQRK